MLPFPESKKISIIQRLKKRRITVFFFSLLLLWTFISSPIVHHHCKFHLAHPKNINAVCHWVKTGKNFNLYKLYFHKIFESSPFYFLDSNIDYFISYILIDLSISPYAFFSLFNPTLRSPPFLTY